MITELLRRLFDLLSSDPDVAARFVDEPTTVLTEVGLDTCEMSELADALPLAVADLPAEQATLILDRCGPVESWAGETVASVLCRVAQDPAPAPSWADELAEPDLTPPVASPPAADHEVPPAADETVDPADPVVPEPGADHEVPVVDEPPVVEDPPVVVEDPPVVVEDPPVVVEDPPVVAEDPPVVAEDPPVVAEDPPVVVEDPPVVDEPPVDVPPADDPGGEVLIPPSDEPDFVDFKSAVRAAREAIAAGDTDALAEAVQSVEPGARADLAASLRDELLVTGTSPDDPVITVLEEQIVDAGGVVPDDAADAEVPADEDPLDSDAVTGADLVDAGVVGVPGAGGNGAAEEAPPDGAADGLDDFDAAGVAEKLGFLIQDGRPAEAGAILDRLTPEQRSAVVDAIGDLDDTQIDPAAANVLVGIDVDAADQTAAIQDSADAFLESIRQDDEQAAEDAAEDAAADETGVTKEFEVQRPSTGLPEVTDGSSNTVIIGEEDADVTEPVVADTNPEGADAAATDDADLDFGSGVTGADGGGGVAPQIPATDLPSAPPVVAVPGSATGDDPNPEELVGGDDFFGGEASSGEVIPLDPADEAEPDIADEDFGGEDFFGGEVPGTTPDEDDSFLTPEQIAELEAIDAEAAEAIIDNFDD